MPPSVAIMEIAPGEAGIFQSLEAMRLGVRKELSDPLVRDTAGRLVAGCGPADDACRAAAVFSFVRQKMDYVPDPVDVEAVGLASYHLQQIAETGMTYGDCDDAAVLVATLAMAVGIPARFAVASFRDDLELHHVWAEVRLQDTGWENLDTFRAERLQANPTRIVYRAI